MEPSVEFPVWGPVDERGLPSVGWSRDNFQKRGGELAMKDKQLGLEDVT